MVSFDPFQKDEYYSGQESTDEKTEVEYCTLDQKDYKLSFLLDGKFTYLEQFCGSVLDGQSPVACIEMCSFSFFFADEFLFDLS